VLEAESAQYHGVTSSYYRETAEISSNPLFAKIDAIDLKG
jgi:hypothetical protein